MPNKSDNFNFEEFSVDIIKAIDSSRSSFSFGTPEELKDGANADPKESRINAFYRYLGLPAVWPDEKKNRPDERNNGNIHKISFRQFEKSLNERQQNFFNRPTENEIIQFLDVNKKKLSDSIPPENNKSGGKEKVRIRGSLFPMVVDGRIWVRPKSRRTAGAFMDIEERTDGNFTYQRPLIEIILHLRLIGDNVADSGVLEDILLSFQVDSLKELAGSIDTEFEKILNSINSVFETAIQKVMRVRVESGIEIIPTIANIVQQNPKTRINPKKKGEVDDLQEFIEYENILNNAIMAIFKFENSSKNMLDSALGNLLIGILSPPTEKTTTSVKEQEVDRRVEKINSNAKSAYRSLDLLLGTFSGISGVDIIVVTKAMFDIETKYLIALLNGDAKDRLKVSYGASVVNEANGISVEDAIDKLENTVRDIMKMVSEDASITKHDEKSQNKSDKSS